MRFRVLAVAAVFLLAVGAAACGSSSSPSSAPLSTAPAASVGQVVTEAEVDLNDIDSVLRTVDAEQATVNSGLTADEGDPSK